MTQHFTYSCVGLTAKPGHLCRFLLFHPHVEPHLLPSQGPCPASQPVAKAPVPDLDSAAFSSLRLKPLSHLSAHQSTCLPLIWTCGYICPCPLPTEEFGSCLWATIFLPLGLATDWTTWVWVPESSYQDSFFNPRPTQSRYMGFRESSNCQWYDLGKLLTISILLFSQVSNGKIRPSSWVCCED